MMELTAAQAAVVALVATLAIQLMKLLLAKKGVTVHRDIVTGVLFLVSLFLAWVWIKPVLPEGQPTIDMLETYLTISVSVLGFATLIYNLLLEKVFKALGWTADMFLKKEEPLEPLPPAL